MAIPLILLKWLKKKYGQQEAQSAYEGGTLEVASHCMWALPYAGDVSTLD